MADIMEAANQLDADAASLDDANDVLPLGVPGVPGSDDAYGMVVDEFKERHGIGADRQVLAWCTFDGSGSDPISSADGYNVASITDNGTGDYTVTFTNDLPNDDYALCGIGRRNTQSESLVISVSEVEQGSARITTRLGTNVLFDAIYVALVCIGG